MRAAGAVSFPFDADKATEVAAQFLQFEKGSINVMRLAKLIYLLDRESIRQRGVPVVGGVDLSMKNGPVTSEILDLINSGELWHRETNWEIHLRPGEPQRRIDGRSRCRSPLRV
jgi:hypothetical protein